MPPYLRIGGRTLLNKHTDGACVFLDRETKHCRIHEKHGFDAKPLACRIYPFSLRAVPEGWSASLRFDCPSVAKNEGEPLHRHLSWLGPLSRELTHDGDIGSDCPRLFDREWATPFETAAAISLFSRLLTQSERSTSEAVARAADTTTTLLNLDYTSVREERFKELLDMLLKSAGGDSERAQPPTPSQRAMLRELTYAHAEHLSPTEQKSRGFSRLLLRFKHLGRARRFRRGKGAVPNVWGVPKGIRLEEASKAQPARSVSDSSASTTTGSARDTPRQGDRMNELLKRYLIQRLESRSIFGHGYYEWPMFEGLLALWASVAVVGYLARLFAVAAGRERLIWEDAFEALRIVDRSATRSPALGRGIERWRIRWLARGGGIARLVNEYALTQDAPFGENLG